MARPRQPDIDQRLLDAARVLLARDGYDALTMEAVAAEAGVGKPALYLRYPTRAHLVFAATVEASVLPELPDTGGFRSDLTLAVQMLAWSLRNTPRPVAAEQFAESIRDAGFARQVAEATNAPALDAVHVIWRRAVERGEVDPELDGRARLIDLSSILVMRILYFHLDVDEDDIAAIVEHFMHGATGSRPVPTDEGDSAP